MILRSSVSFPRHLAARTIRNLKWENIYNREHQNIVLLCAVVCANVTIRSLNEVTDHRSQKYAHRNETCGIQLYI